MADPSKGAGAQALVDGLVASWQAESEAKAAILRTLEVYSKTVTDKMNELVQCNPPGAAERAAAEHVRLEVLKVTKDLVRALADAVPVPNQPGDQGG